MFLSSLTERIGGESADGFRISDQAEQLIAGGADVIALTLGDSDFDTPSPIIDKAVNALRNGRTHYTPVVGEEPLRSAVARAQKESDGVQWEADNVTIFPGAQSALFSTLLCVAERGKKVAVFDPMYATYPAVVGASGAELLSIRVDIPFGRNSKPLIDFERLEAEMSKGVSAILLNVPNNPGGFTFDDGDLERVARICVENDIWLVCDEVYREQMFEGEHKSMASLPGMKGRIVVLNSLSKSHAMTGWRIGWALAPTLLSRHLGRVAQCSLFGSPPFIQDAATLAVEQGSKFTSEYKDELRRRRDALLRELAVSSILVANRPVGGMFALVNIAKTGLDSITFADRALNEFGVAVIPGTAFSKEGSSFVRVSFSRNVAVVTEGARRLVRFADHLVSIT